MNLCCPLKPVCLFKRVYFQSMKILLIFCKTTQCIFAVFFKKILLLFRHIFFRPRTLFHDHMMPPHGWTEVLLSSCVMLGGSQWIYQGSCTCNTDSDVLFFSFLFFKFLHFSKQISSSKYSIALCDSKTSETLCLQTLKQPWTDCDLTLISGIWKWTLAVL